MAFAPHVPSAKPSSLADMPVPERILYYLHTLGAAAGQASGYHATGQKEVIAHLTDHLDAIAARGADGELGYLGRRCLLPFLPPCLVLPQPFVDAVQRIGNQAHTVSRNVEACGDSRGVLADLSEQLAALSFTPEESFKLDEQGVLDQQKCRVVIELLGRIQDNLQVAVAGGASVASMRAASATAAAELRGLYRGDVFALQRLQARMVRAAPVPRWLALTLEPVAEALEKLVAATSPEQIRWFLTTAAEELGALGKGLAAHGWNENRDVALPELVVEPSSPEPAAAPSVAPAELAAPAEPVATQILNWLRERATRCAEAAKTSHEARVEVARDLARTLPALYLSHKDSADPHRAGYWGDGASAREQLPWLAPSLVLPASVAEPLRIYAALCAAEAAAKPSPVIKLSDLVEDLALALAAVEFKPHEAVDLQAQADADDASKARLMGQLVSTLKWATEDDPTDLEELREVARDSSTLLEALCHPWTLDSKGERQRGAAPPAWVREYITSVAQIFWEAWGSPAALVRKELAAGGRILAGLLEHIRTVGWSVRWSGPSPVEAASPVGEVPAAAGGAAGAGKPSEEEEASPLLTEAVQCRALVDVLRAWSDLAAEVSKDGLGAEIVAVGEFARKLDARTLESVPAWLAEYLGNMSQQCCRVMSPEFVLTRAHSTMHAMHALLLEVADALETKGWSEAISFNDEDFFGPEGFMGEALRHRSDSPEVDAQPDADAQAGPEGSSADEDSPHSMEAARSDEGDVESLAPRGPSVRLSAPQLVPVALQRRVIFEGVKGNWEPCSPAEAVIARRSDYGVLRKLVVLEDAQALLDAAYGDAEVQHPLLLARLAEADRRAGAAERELEQLRADLAAQQRWVDEAREEAGYHRNTSFDTVWSEILELAKTAQRKPASGHYSAPPQIAGLQDGVSGD